MQKDPVVALSQVVKPLYPAHSFEELKKEMHGCNVTKSKTYRCFDTFYQGEWYSIMEDQDGIDVAEIYRKTFISELHHRCCLLKKQIRNLIHRLI